MPTISAGSSQTFTAGVKDQLFTLTANGGALGTVTGAVSASFGPGAERRSFGPFAVGQAITVTVQAGSVIVEYGDSTPEETGESLPAMVNTSGDLQSGGAYQLWKRSSALACMVPSSGSVAANGALTLTTAVPTAGGYTWGCYMYFPANAVYSGSVAGLYFVVMSSTTLGTIYDNRLAAGDSPTVPTTLVPIVAAGPGAYTQTTSPVDLTTITIPANMLGANGWMLCAPTWAFPNNANNKVISLVLGSTNIYAKTRTTATQEMPLIDIRNRGVVNRQFAGWGSSGAPGTASTAGFGSSSVDTSAATNVIVRGQLAVATDFIILESFSLTAYPFA